MSKLVANCSIHIVGLGLMGGSLAMALGRKAATITAEDNRSEIIEQAVDKGIIVPGGRLEEADIVVLAVPADRIAGLLPSLKPKPGSLVLDLGSTKSLICDQMDRLGDGVLAVGGHPMCGRAENGFANALPNLYEAARFVLCETALTTTYARSLAERLVTALGAVPLWMDPVVHDRTVALTSHLPHLLSVALMGLAIDAAGNDGGSQMNVFELAAGGFDGATRLARTDVAMLAGMFSTNADPLRTIAAEMRGQLEWLETILDDPNRLNAELAAVVEARRGYTGRYGERIAVRLA